MRSRTLCSIGLFAALLATSCLGPSPARLPHGDAPLVVVNSLRLPDDMVWYTRFAEHSWVDVRPAGDDSWTRIEVRSATSGVEVGPIGADTARAAKRWGRRVSVLGTLSGDRAQRAIPRLLALAAAETDFGPGGRPYRAWPGPNSNTFVARLIDGTPDLNAELHHNAVGKDYPRGLRAGRSSSGYGFELDAGYLGLGLGLRQGVELHLAQLTLGIGLWPPVLKLPFLPRIGIPPGWGLGARD